MTRPQTNQKTEKGLHERSCAEKHCSIKQQQTTAMEQQTLQQQQRQSSAEVDREFNAECLEAHNRCRDLHGCPPLALSPQLAGSAQAWANHLAGIGKLQHSTPNPRGSYGENIAMKMVSGSREYRGSQCTAQWYSEIEMYDFSGGENQMKCGHFSQVVWKGTKEAGFGKAIAPDGKMFAVGQYAPAGNFMNKWRENIPAPLSGSIKVPTHEDIMGRPNGDSQQRQQQPQRLDQQLQQQQQQRPQPVSAGGDPEPQPEDPRDRPVGKATKTRIVNGEKSVTVTVTFIRPDGSRYQVAKETAGQREAPHAKLAELELEPIVQPAKFRRNFAAPSAADDDVDGGGDAGDDDGVVEVATFAEEVTRQHNQLRRRHGAPDLARSDSLDQLAQAWAQSLCRSGDLRHSRPVDYGNGQVGQNIAKQPAAAAVGGDVGGGKQGVRQLVQQWYAERLRFPFGQPEPDDIAGGHFSQLAWCATEKLGVGLAVDKASGDRYTACFYYPCGNLVGQFADNVLPSYD